MMEGLVPYVPWTVKPFLANLWLFRPIVALAANFDKKILQIYSLSFIYVYRQSQTFCDAQQHQNTVH